MAEPKRVFIQGRSWVRYHVEITKGHIPEPERKYVTPVPKDNGDYEGLEWYSPMDVYRNAEEESKNTKEKKGLPYHRFMNLYLEDQSAVEAFFTEYGPLGITPPDYESPWGPHSSWHDRLLSWGKDSETGEVLGEPLEAIAQVQEEMRVTINLYGKLQEWNALGEAIEKAKEKVKAGSLVKREHSQKEIKELKENRQTVFGEIEYLVARLDSILNVPRKANSPIDALRFALTREEVRNNPDPAALLVPYARSLVEIVINSHLVEVRPCMDGMKMSYSFPSLLSAFWLMFYLDITGGKKVRRCPACGDFFTAMREDNDYCKPECGKRAGERRRYARKVEARKANGTYRPPGRPKKDQ